MAAGEVAVLWLVRCVSVPMPTGEKIWDDLQGLFVGDGMMMIVMRFCNGD